MPAARSQVTHHGRLQKLAKERNRRKRTFQRRLELETLELRYLLTSVVEPVQADALTVPDQLLETLAWEAPVEAAAWWEDAPVAAENQVQDAKVLEKELPTDEDAAIGIEVASFEEGVPVEIALLSDDESFADEMLKVVPLRTAAFGAFEDGSVETTGEMPMLMAFGAVEDVGVETTGEMPMLMAFGAVEDVGVETTGEMPMLMGFGAVEDGSVQKADDGQDESPLLRTLLTSEVSEDAGSDVPVRMYSMAGSDEMLTAADSSDQMMLLSAMGPSPWQNLNDPDDVNVDGWTTARDALLVINRINDGVPLSALAAPVTLFVDVNGDRNLDAGDAAQVINTLNGADQALPAVEEASRVAPLWFDNGPEEIAAWEDTVATEEADSTELGDEALVS
ncbi:MAG TPA: dockerin type I domain-containing protein, partial [Candidatus Anammoximicrobium sp.]|nr:dockerin type I domain-containing protein [Candidatus Anammoximicrobium sp.]